jgi:serine/threonine protein kinase
VILSRGHDICCDWWALGIIVFEFLSGSPPFHDEVQYLLYEKILRGISKIEWPRSFDYTSKDLIKKLLVTDPTKRLGSGNCYKMATTVNTNPVTSSVFLTEESALMPGTQSINSEHNLTNNENEEDEENFVISEAQKKKIQLGTEEIKKHRWFISITDWSDVYERRLKPPFIPQLAHEGDISSFDKYETPDLTKVPYVSKKHLDSFEYF